MRSPADPRFLAAIALPLIVASSAPGQQVADPVDVMGTIRPVSAPLRVFVSGHSLTDHPFPDYLAAIGGEGGGAPAWNMQHLFGSSIKDRSSGPTGEGFRRGVDRHGRSIDVLRELRGAAPAYDVLILAEQHALLESLVWQDTIGSVLDYEAHFHAANPNGRTYLFSTWLEIDRRDDPRRWIRYERAAADGWRCITAQVNRSLAMRGEQRRVILIPAAEGLAALVSAGVSGELPGIGDGDLFTDEVHLAAAGSYYVALLSYGVLHGGLPAHLSAPKEVRPALAHALQRFARAFLAGLPRRASRLSEADCRSYLAKFAPHYLSYVRDVRWKKGGLVRANLKWARLRLTWPLLFGTSSSANPLRVRP